MKTPLIAPGKRHTLPRPFGSADALLLARHAQSQAAQKRLTAIFTAEPADTQRLEGELSFFAPELRIAVFPDWETLPYDTFSPHQDLISERLATLWRLLQAHKDGDLDVVLMPASTALVRLAPPSFLAAYTFNFRQKEKLDEAALDRKVLDSVHKQVGSACNWSRRAIEWKRQGAHPETDLMEAHTAVSKAKMAVYHELIGRFSRDSRVHSTLTACHVSLSIMERLLGLARDGR